MQAAVDNPGSLGLGLLIVVISAACTAGFLVTPVGRLAALDQQVRQLESFGIVVGEDTYGELRRLVPYRPMIDAAFIIMGWPVMWLAMSRVLWWFGRSDDEPPQRPKQVLSVVVHASAILALRSIVAMPINYARESIGGATSLSVIMPAFGESTFPARLLGALDLFIVWWVVLIALGLSILYQTRTMTIARWLFGAYAGGAVALALTQALRGGI
jgi:hypothetical protein